MRCEDLTSFEGKYDDEFPQDCYVIVCDNEAALNMWDGALYNYHHVSVTNRQGGKERTLYGGEAYLCKVAEGDQDDHQKNGKSNSDLAASTQIAHVLNINTTSARLPPQNMNPAAFVS